MSHNHKSRAHITPQIKEKPVKLPPVDRIKAPRRLVGKHYRRVVDQSARNSRTLPFSA